MKMKKYKYATKLIPPHSLEKGRNGKRVCRCVLVKHEAGYMCKTVVDDEVPPICRKADGALVHPVDALALFYYAEREKRREELAKVVADLVRLYHCHAKTKRVDDGVETTLIKDGKPQSYTLCWDVLDNPSTAREACEIYIKALGKEEGHAPR